MPFTSVITQNTRDALQVTDVPISTEEVDSIGIATTYGDNYIVTPLEVVILDKLIKGTQAVNIVSIDVSNVTLDASHNSTFGTHVLVNNSSVNTPDVAIVTQYLEYTANNATDASFTSLIGTNTSGSIYGSVDVVEDDTNPFVIENVYFTFTQNEDPTLNNDFDDTWYVAFDNSDNLARAVNSQLNALDGSDPAYPIVVTEDISFNEEYALGGEVVGDGIDQFQRIYTDSNTIGTVADRFTGVPTVSTFTANSNNHDSSNNYTMYYLESQSGSGALFDGSGRSFGTWRFTQLDPVIDVSSVGSFPFGYEVSGNTPTFLPNPVSSTVFHTLFPDETSDDAYSLYIRSTDGSGGYYAQARDSGSVDISYNNRTSMSIDSDGKNIFKLDSSNLINNFTYTKDYLSINHHLNIKNGNLVVDLSTNAQSSTQNDIAVSTGAEFLGDASANINGHINLTVQAALNGRVSVDSSDLSANVFVAYGSNDTTESSASYDATIGTITNDMKNSQDVSLNTTCVLNGFRQTDIATGGYNYTSSPSKYKYVDGNGSVLYSNSEIDTPDASGLVLTVTGQLETLAAYHISVDVEQSLTNPDDPLYALAEYKGVSSTDTAIAHSSRKDISGNYTYFDPVIGSTNFNEFAYNQYRVVYQPKTMNDLIEQGLSINNNWEILLGHTKLNDYGEVDFDADPTDNYLYTKYGNLSTLGTNGEGLNYKTLSGINVENLGSLYEDFSLNIIYGTAGDIAGTDIVTFTVTGPNGIDLHGNESGSTTFSLHSVETYSDGNGNFRSVVQIPIGNYTNLYLKTPLLSSTNTNTASETIGTNTATLSFTRKTVMSLWGSIQATNTNDTPANAWQSGTVTDWTTISSPTQSSNPANWGAVDVATYITTPVPSSSQKCYIYKPHTETYAEIQIQLKLNTSYSKQTFQLSNPGYVYLLRTSNAPTITATRHETDLAGFEASVFNSTTFNPINYSSPGTSLSVTASSNGTYDSMEIVDSEYQITYTINYSVNGDQTYKIWYCPEDVYHVEYNLDAASDDFYLQNDNVNGTLSIIGGDINGIALVNQGTILPGQSRLFSLLGQTVSIELVDGTPLSPAISGYELGTNSSLTFGNDTKTRTVELPYYRGYVSSSLSSQDQIYILTRTRAVAHFEICTSPTPLTDTSYNPLTDTSYNIYKELNDKDIVLNSGVGSIGLKVSFYESMLSGAADLREYTVDVNGDTVTIDDYGAITNTDLTNYVLYTFPNPDYKIVSGKVTSDNGVEYSIIKDKQTVEISYSSRYSYASESDLRSAFSSIGEYSTNNDVMLNSGIPITPDLTVYGPAGYRIATSSSGLYNTPVTYLSIPPPFVSFTGLPKNAVTVLPYQLSTVSSQIKTVYMRVDSNSKTDYTPFIGIAGMNNMTFNTTGTHDMIDYVTSDAGPVDIRVQGNNVVITEKLNSAPDRVIYTGPIQSISGSPIVSSTIDVDNAIYTFSYYQNLLPTNTVYLITLAIHNAFVIEDDYVRIFTPVTSQISLYGYSSYINEDLKYAMTIHKYIDIESRDLPILYNNSFRFTPSFHYTCDVQFADISTTLTSSPYNLSTMLNGFNTSTLTAWTNTGDSGSDFDNFRFSFVALSTTGETQIRDILTVDQYSEQNPTDVAQVHATFITMPDTFNVISADGSPVIRITYNGSIITPMVSTTQVNLFNSSFTHQSESPNQELVDFNMTSAPIDISGN
jgi:hypothetical protein